MSRVPNRFWAFVRGVGSILSLGGGPPTRRRVALPTQSDADALASDWAKVAGDFNLALGRRPAPPDEAGTGHGATPCPDSCVRQPKETLESRRNTGGH